MKNKYRIVALFTAVFLSATLMTACGKNNSSQSSKTSTDISQTSTTTSQSEIGSQNKSDDSSKTSEDQVSNASSTNSSASSNSSSAVSSNSDSSSTSSADVSSSSSSAQSSVTSEDGYFFDDEQIVKDYHTATVFTSNDDFNKLFANNSIDTDYNSELQNASTVTEMRSITSTYAQKWKEQVDVAYNKLSELLKDKADAKAALEKSQTEWTNSVDTTQSSFYSQAKENETGSEGLLNADTAIMNYYKGRAAILYEQIYELTGSFEM